MLKLLIDEKGENIEVEMAGCLIDICADVMVSLTIIREKIEKRFNKEVADEFINMVSDNMEFVKNPEELKEEVNAERVKKIDSMIKELEKMKKSMEKSANEK